MLRIIGLKVVAIKGIQDDKRRSNVPIEFMLFDDGKTFIEFREQDYYSYHDCSSSARQVDVYENKERYDFIMANYKDSTENDF